MDFELSSIYSIAGAGARYTVQRYYVRSIRLWRRVLSTPREDIKFEWGGQSTGSASIL